MKKISILCLALLSALAMFVGCKADPEAIDNTPEVYADEASELLRTSAVLTGRIMAPAKASIKEYGFLLSSSSDFSSSDTQTIKCDENLKEFSAQVTDLEIGGTYFYAAYATNGLDRMTSTVRAFTTPTRSGVLLSDLQMVDEKTATFSARVSDTGGGEINAVGLCWATDNTPTTYDETVITTLNSDNTFTASLTGLEAGKTYYVRAFADSDILGDGTTQTISYSRDILEIHLEEAIKEVPSISVEALSSTTTTITYRVTTTAVDQVRQMVIYEEALEVYGEISPELVFQGDYEIEPNTTVELTVPDLVPATTYYVFVAAKTGEEYLIGEPAIIATQPEAEPTWMLSGSLQGGVNEIYFVEDSERGMFVAEDVNLTLWCRFKVYQVEDRGVAYGYADQTRTTHDMVDARLPLDLNGEDIEPTHAGVFDIWFDLDGKYLYIMSDGKTPEEADDYEPKPEETIPAQPTILWRDYDISQQYRYEENMPIIIDITAEGGINTLTVDIDSDVLTRDELLAVGLDSHIDLVNPGNMNDALISLGFLTGENIKGKTSLSIDLSNFCAIIPLISSGDNYANFTITVSDAYAQESDETLQLLFGTNKKVPETWKIYYTSFDGSVIEPSPNSSDPFNANIISNTYEGGKGVIIFDGELTAIGDSAFEGQGLTSITIPESVVEIGVGAFTGCGSLTAIYSQFSSSDNRCLILNGELNSFAPAGLTEYTIPDQVTKIGNYALYGCSELTAITIPESVVEIGNYALEQCFGLINITIPDSVTKIGFFAFCRCENLKEITLSKNLASINQHAFYMCTSLESITFHDGISEIWNNAFYFCSSLKTVYCNSQTPPVARFYADSWASWAAFDSCSDELKIYVPNASVETYKSAPGWSDYADRIYPMDGESDGRRKIYVRTTDNWSSMYLYSWNLDNLTNYHGAWPGSLLTETEVINGETYFVSTLSEELEGVKLGLVFNNGSGTQSQDVHITVGENCYFLVSNSVAKLIDPANPDAGISVNPENCRILYTSTDGSIITPYANNVFGANIISNTYENGQGIITFDGEVASIGAYAFYDDTRLKSITIPNSVTSIVVYAFTYCSSLEQVTLSENLVDIGLYAFGGCESLTEITIPEQVTSIGEEAFYYCTNLSKVYCTPTVPPKGGARMFSSISTDGQLYVPAASLESYKTAEFWSDYASYIVGYNF